MTHRTRRARRGATIATLLVLAVLATASSATSQTETWRYLRPGNTGIQGDYCEAIWIGADGDPIIAGYNPFWEDGGFAKFVQDENRWENYSTVDYPEIGDRDLVGAARVHDITADADGKLWMATWIALLEFDPAVGPTSLKRWDPGNSLHPGGRTMDVEVAPDGSVWATCFSGTPSGGLLRYEPALDTWTFWGYGDTAKGWPELTASCDELAIQPDPTGGYTVWIEAANTNRMITFDSETQLFTLLPQAGHPGEVTGLAGHEAVDDVGNLWVWRLPPGGGIQSRLEVRRPDGTWFVPPFAPVGADGFKAFGDMQAVAADPSNVVWRFDGTTWQDLGQWKTGNWTYAVDIDAAGNVWASGIGGAGRRDAATGLWQRYRVTNTSMLDYFTRDLVLDDQGGVWMTGNAGPGIGGVQHFDGERWFNFNDVNYGLGGPWGYPTDNADAVALRDSGEVLVNPTFNGIHEWSGVAFTDLAGMGTSDGLAVDSLDRVWSIGNYYSLAYRDEGGWTSVPIAGWGANVQRDPDAPGMVWALANFEVVRTDGVYRFARETIDFPQFTPTSGTFTSVAAAPGGIGWVGSTKGLFRVDSNTGDYEWYHPSNSAIPGNQIWPLAVSPDGRLWFTNWGTQSSWPTKGLGWFDGTDFGYYPQTEVGVGLPHGQIADIEIRPVDGGYEVWSSCTSEGVAVLTVMTELCQPDIGFGGPGDATLRVCGDVLATGGTADLTVTGAPPSSVAWVLAGLVNAPTPFYGGKLVPVPFLLAQPLATDAGGTAGLSGIPGGNGPLDVYVQAVLPDASQPFGYGLSNAVQVTFEP